MIKCTADVTKKIMNLCISCPPCFVMLFILSGREIDLLVFRLIVLLKFAMIDFGGGGGGTGGDDIS